MRRLGIAVAVVFAGACGSGSKGPTLHATTVQPASNGELTLGVVTFQGGGPWEAELALDREVAASSMHAVTADGCALLMVEVSVPSADGWTTRYESRSWEAPLADDDLPFRRVRVKLTNDRCARTAQTTVSLGARESPWRRVALVEVTGSGVDKRLPWQGGTRVRVRSGSECGRPQLRFLDGTGQVLQDVPKTHQEDQLAAPPGTATLQVTARSEACHPFDPAGPNSVAPSWDYTLQISSAAH